MDKHIVFLSKATIFLTLNAYKSYVKVEIDEEDLKRHNFRPSSPFSFHMHAIWIENTPAGSMRLGNHIH